MSKDDLLRPTLSAYRKPPALYGSTGFFLSGFFGGPAGIAVYAGANALRLGRLARDLPIIVAVCASAFLAMLELHRWGGLASLAGYLGGSLERNFNLIVRACGIGCFGAIYLLHRQFFRAARVTGVEPLPGWLPGVAAVAVGLAANTAFSSLAISQSRRAARFKLKMKKRQRLRRGRERSRRGGSSSEKLWWIGGRV